jgi:maleate isomerase
MIGRRSGRRNPEYPAMAQARIGMIVPSLNTIAEDDCRRFLPAEVGYHVHRVRLRRRDGRVSMDGLLQAWREAEDEAGLLADLRPTAVLFNCTGASVAHGPRDDSLLARRMSQSLGLPSTNTMLAIKQALKAVGATAIVHVCPFADEFSEIERASLADAGLRIVRSVGLGFTDARAAAQMTPEDVAEIALKHDTPEADALLLSCANVRAFEAVAALEARLGKPVITSNQAALWAALRLAGWTEPVDGGGRLFDCRALPEVA